MRGVPVCVRACVCGIWLGHNICILRHTPSKAAWYIHIVLCYTYLDRRYTEPITKQMNTCICVHKVRDIHGLASPSGRPRRASQCGTAWAEVPARCQGFVCHATLTAAIARTQYTACPGTQDSHTHLHLYMHPYLSNSSPYVFTLFLFSLYFPV